MGPWLKQDRYNYSLIALKQHTYEHYNNNFKKNYKFTVY